MAGMQRLSSLPLWTSIAGKSFVYLAVALLVLGWLLNTPEGLLGKADAVGYAVCHRIDLRSFHLGERQLPLCVRCSGMYLGALTALAFQAMTARRRGGMPPRWMWVVFGLFTLAFALDGLNSYLHLFPGFERGYQPQNWLRLLTGSGMGIVMGAAVYPAFHQTAWQGYDPRPALERWPSLATVVILTLALAGLVLTENPLVLYPLAVLTAAGVLLMLTSIYTMLFLIITRQENRFDSFRQLIFPFLMGFGLALLQIAALDLARYVLTGTWGGFHLG